MSKKHLLNLFLIQVVLCLSLSDQDSDKTKDANKQSVIFLSPCHHKKFDQVQGSDARICSRVLS